MQIQTQNKNIFFSLALSVAVAGLAQADDTVSVFQARSDYRQTDRALNVEWNDLLSQHKQFVIDGKAKQSVVDDLVEDQRSWLAARNTAWGDPEKPDDQDQAKKFNNLTRLDISRILYFKAYTGDRVAPGIVGEYTDSLGGYLTITKGFNDTTFQVDIVVVRGKDSKTGQDTAELTLSSRKGQEADGTLKIENDDNTVCLIKYRRVAHVVTLTEIADTTSTCQHDAGASYSGKYLKTLFKNDNAN